MDNKSTLNTTGRVLIKLGTYALLAFWAVMVLFPFYWMIITSLKTPAEYNATITPSFLPTSFEYQNYIDAFGTQGVDLLRYLLNTLIFTVATTALMMVVIIPAAYAFAKLNFKGKNLTFTLFLSLMMIPQELVIVTNYYTVSGLDLRNTFTGLILPSVISVFYVYLLKENIAQIPEEMYKAAKVDGTSDLKFLWRVVLPICRPTIVTIAILKVIECWNSYVWPRRITDNDAYSLVSNGIQKLKVSGMGRDNIPVTMAAIVVVSLPLIVLFLIFRKKIMEEVARGGTKG